MANGICGSFDGYDLIFDSDSPTSIVFQCPNIGSGAAYFPINSLDQFNGERSNGDWILEVGHAGGVTTEPATLQNWSLVISGRGSYNQEDLVLHTDPAPVRLWQVG